MGALLSRLSSVITPARFRADSPNASNYTTAFFAGDDMADSLVQLSNAGVNVTPELAMTLAAVYSAVTTIAYDLATLPLLTYKYRPDGGKDAIRGRAIDLATGGIRDLAYLLRWAPNDFQTATEYFVSMVAQFLLRSRAYAEIVPGPNGFLNQLLPRHPDRVQARRLANGRLTYRLIERNGATRYVTQDEMHVWRDLSLDGISGLSRTQFGSNVFGSALAAERAAGRFFKSGMNAAVVASYKSDTGMEDEDEAQLHSSITRFAAGVENTFGVLLVPDDVSIKTLGIEPEKAQMMLAREWGAREVARFFRIPARKLQIAGTATYASAVQDQVDYVVGCLRPTAHTIEQAVQRDLILAKDTYFVQFQLDELMRGDPATRAAYYEAAIKNRWMRPSEVRVNENMNPDPDLDAISERDNQPGQNGSRRPDAAPGVPPPNTRAQIKGLLAVHDNAVRCLRRERAAVEKLAKKHAADVDAWQAGLRDFFSEHAGFVAQVMRIPLPIARGYAAQHGSELEAKGVIVHNDEWERDEADELTALALTDADRLAA